MHRLLTVGPDHDSLWVPFHVHPVGDQWRSVMVADGVTPPRPVWVRLYVRPYADHWAAMLVGDDAPPPEPVTVTGLTFFGATPEGAEREAFLSALLNASAPLA